MAENPHVEKDNNTKKYRIEKDQTSDKALSYFGWTTLPSYWMGTIREKKSRIRRKIDKEVDSIVQHTAFNSHC